MTISKGVFSTSDLINRVRLIIGDSHSNPSWSDDSLINYFNSGLDSLSGESSFFREKKFFLFNPEINRYNFGDNIRFLYGVYNQKGLPIPIHTRESVKSFDYNKNTTDPFYESSSYVLVDNLNQGVLVFSTPKNLTIKSIDSTTKTDSDFGIVTSLNVDNIDYLTDLVILYNDSRKAVLERGDSEYSVYSIEYSSKFNIKPDSNIPTGLAPFLTYFCVYMIFSSSNLDENINKSIIYRQNMVEAKNYLSVQSDFSSSKKDREFGYIKF